MARLIQLLMPLIYAVLAVAHPLDPPFHIPGLPHLPHPDLAARHQQQLDKHFVHQSWVHHVMGQKHPNLDEDVYNRHHKEESYEDFNPFLDGGFDPYFGSPFGMGNFDPMTGITFPGMSNGFNIPNNGLNSHNPQPSQVVSNLEEQHKKDSNDDSAAVKNPTEKPEDLSSSDKKPAEQDKDSKLNDASIPDIPKKPEDLPPKTNEIKKNITSEDNGDKNKKEVNLDKNKDYLLVGSGNNGNNVYLLHENKPNPTTVVVPNANQPTNNVVYIPYYAGQNNNPVQQVVNQQPTNQNNPNPTTLVVPNANQPTNNVVYIPYNAGQNNNPVPQVVNQQPTNLQVAPDKITVNGYNNGIASTAQPINTGNQNPGYVLVYSNGQLTQIPGVVVNSAQNNVAVQNSNPIQGTNYVIANAVPNNVQATPNVGTNVIYATLPNQGSNSPIVIQMPQCTHNMAHHVCGSGAVVQNPVQGVNNAANVMSNNGLVSNAVYQPNQNFIAQPAVLLTNGVSNGNAQPTTIHINIPSQGAELNNQNGAPQLAVQLPVSSGSNQYNQPIGTNLQSNTAVNAPNQGPVNSQNVVLQPAVQIPANTNPNGYNNNQPIVSIQSPNVATQNQGDNNQNLPIQPSTQVNSAANGNSQPQAPNQEGQGIVSTPSRDEAVNHPKIDIRAAIPETTQNNNGIALDENSLASLGAQPAIMISGFKETADDKNGKAKKAKKDKSKKKNKKNKDSGEYQELKPLTNKKK